MKCKDSRIEPPNGNGLPLQGPSMIALQDLDFKDLPLTVPAVSVRGTTGTYPVRRIFCVGLNYLDHALEMGRTVERNAPFYFTKSPFAIVHSGSTIAYPPQTSNYHHEIEMVVAIGRSAFEMPASQAREAVFGYACGLDMTRRDLQLGARDKGRPWDLGKDVEQSAVISEIVPCTSIGHPLQGEISLAVNGVPRQHSDIDKLIWSIPELIADLSKYYHLGPGDLIYTGTPHGVGPVLPGDVLTGHVAGIASVELSIRSPD
jgi:fumarylpyruvate hydrolase